METGLSLGTNQGDRLALLHEARVRIGTLPGVVERGKSPVYETPPVDVPPEYHHMNYLNSVLIVECKAPPSELIRCIHHIEEEMGRIRGAQRNLPRPIDIDILYAGQIVIKDADLCIPHPRWAERSFVVKPLSDVRPNLIIPGTDQHVKALLETLPDKDDPQLISYQW